MDKKNNNQNKISYGFTLKDLFKTNPLSIILMYLIIYIFGTILVSLIVCKVVGNIHNYTFKEAYNVVVNGIRDEYIKSDTTVYYQAQAYINFFAYMLMFLILPVFGLAYFKEDIKIFKDKKKVLIIIIEAIIFVLVSQGLEKVSSLIINNMGYENVTSANETLIENMMAFSFKPIVFISSAIFAPVVEELVYRKSVIALSERALSSFSEKHKKLSIAIHLSLSSLIFALPHMLSSNNLNALVWFILFIVYFISGLGLAVIYYFTNKNIYASTIAHMSNNLVALIFMMV